jgi:hypothetical protein
MKFDSNLAWQRASSAVAANREVVLALAGVFFLLPTLGLTLLVPPPQPSPGASIEAVLKSLNEYYSAAFPYLLPIAVLQAMGMLALLTLLTDKTRPTVGDAIRLGLKGLLPYVLAQMLVVIGLGVAGGAVIAIGAASGIAALAVVGAAITFSVVAYVMIRTSLLGPVIVVDGERNAVAAIMRSWRLTQGNAARIGVFYLLVWIAFMFVIAVITLVLGILFALVGSQEVSRMAEAVISSGLNSVMALYFVGIFAAVHGQLGRHASTGQGDLPG